MCKGSFCSLSKYRELIVIKGTNWTFFASWRAQLLKKLKLGLFVPHTQVEGPTWPFVQTETHQPHALVTTNFTAAVSNALRISYTQNQSK